VEQHVLHGADIQALKLFRQLVTDAAQAGYR